MRTVTDNQEGRDLDTGETKTQQCKWNSLMEQ